MMSAQTLFWGDEDNIHGSIGGRIQTVHLPKNPERTPLLEALSVGIFSFFILVILVIAVSTITENGMWPPIYLPYHSS